LNAKTLYESPPLICAEKLVETVQKKYVTHVYWAFANLTSTGEVEQNLQAWDDKAVLRCMSQMRM